jgi:hypothetical protein
MRAILAHAHDNEETIRISLGKAMHLTPITAIRGKYTCNDISASVPLELVAYANGASVLLIYYNRGV